MPISEVYNEDNMVGMARYPDGFFSLGIVDPPYALNFGSYNRTNKNANGVRFKANKYHNGNWDNSIPKNDYFEELFRVCENVIVWGGNYFPLPPTQCFVFWYKRNPVKNFSDGEMAWTSFSRPALCFDYKYYGNIQGNTSADKKIHPTQKPVELYKWLLEQFGNGGGRILDTHLGSGSSRIAAYDMGFDFYGWELDKEYFDAAEKRFQDHIKQQVIKF